MKQPSNRSFDPAADAPRPAAWGAVLALSLAAFTLVASEFMPVSLLTPIAADLRVSEGQAGQGIAVSGALALVTSLLISSVAKRVDRKRLLLALTGLMIVSGAVVAAAPNYGTFMIGRALIGVAIGGFWSMSAATAMRLVPDALVPRALAVVNGGNALATVVAAPLGSFLGGLIGWRGAFFCVVPVALIALLWQAMSLPGMPREARPGSGNPMGLLKRRDVALGMAGVGVFFMGQFALFTYLRPFLETVAHVSVPTLSLLLLVMGVAGLIGTWLIGGVLNAGLYRTLSVIPLAMAGIAIALVFAGGWLSAIAVLLGFWGLLGTAAPVGWWTWLARALPGDAEAGGGLMVAIIQLAITVGAAGGGLLYDRGGHTGTFSASAGLLVVAAALAVCTERASRTSHAVPA